MKLCTIRSSDSESASGVDEDAPRLQQALFTRELLELQRTEQSHGAFSGTSRQSCEASLEAYVHETARRSLHVLDQIAERRAVVVAFAKVVGLEAAFAAEGSLLPADWPI